MDTQKPLPRPASPLAMRVACYGKQQFSNRICECFNVIGRLLVSVVYPSNISLQRASRNVYNQPFFIRKPSKFVCSFIKIAKKFQLSSYPHVIFENWTIPQKKYHRTFFNLSWTRSVSYNVEETFVSKYV